MSYQGLQMKAFVAVCALCFLARQTTGTPACKLDPTGVNYRGNVSQTLSGRTCQQWTSQYPHDHTRTPSEYPNTGLGGHNYCRNPDNVFTAWCYTTDPEVRWEYCAVGDFDPECTITPLAGGLSECYLLSNATDYRGNISVSRNGHTCQQWSVQTPHEHNYAPSDYPNDGLGDHNLCRNPGGSGDMVWCYTTSPTRWEFCNIGVPRENCNEETTTAETTSVPTPPTPETATTTGSPECQQDPSGATYRGEVSHTVSGRTCQKWTLQAPHEHNRTPEEYPNSGLGDHNYCRNVGASSFTAWCYTTDSDERWEYCPVGTYEPECMAHTTLSPSDCYTDPYATDYSGTINVTRSGYTCQAWTSQYPHEHSRTPLEYPNTGIGEHNYCRNPDTSDMAWCYTTDSNVRWEYCSIGIPQEQCEEEQTTPSLSPTSMTDIVRLSKGPNSWTGRVEINIDGEWGTICDDLWGLDEASTVCRMLGYREGAIRASVRAEFGSGLPTVPIWLDNVDCLVPWDNILECQHDDIGVHNCQHSEDAGVECKPNEEAVETTISSITASNTASSEQMTQVYSNEAVETTISSITASNTASSEQMVQVHSNGGNFTLQDGDSLYISSPNYPANYDSNANVLWVITMPEDCSLVLSVLSFQTENYFDALTVSSESEADQSVVLISRFLSRLAPFNRTYAPSTLMRIQFRTDRSVVYQGFEAELRASCSAEAGETTISSITALNTASSEQMTGEDLNEAVETTILSITTSNTASSQQMTQVHSNGGHFALQDGDSLYISSPNYPANYDSYADVLWVITMPEDCSLVLSVLSFNTESFYDALTVSSESGADQSVVLIDTLSSRLEPFNRTYAPSTLMRIIFRTDSTVEYKGFEAELRASCSAETTTASQTTRQTTQDSNDMTSEAPWTIGGNVDSTGGPIALREGQDYFIGSSSFPSNYPSNATILWQVTTSDRCAIHITFMAFSTEPIYDYLVVGSQDVTPKNMVHRWTGGEVPAPLHLNSNQAWFLFMSDSETEEQGFVAKLHAMCSNSTASIEDVRLVDGNVPQEGRLEVLYQGQWGTVCEDLWERTNAEVVCRMLGYEGADLEYSTTDLWWLIKGSGPILMDNVRCQGNESSLDECSHLGLGVHNCDHSKDVGVTCRTGSEANPSTDNSAIIRLVNGNRPSEGRVEVFRGRSWGTVCDDYWGIEDANVACKMLGYERAELAYREAKFGEGDGAILLDDVSCTGREPSLFACDHSDFADCSHAEDAGVKCLETSGRDLSLA
ncbi:deleted in malignant brain tumors 1 protein isoform X1 [Strongylocentrotus purpuratus]|uniref:Uncharacterized protein n=1 Tax=Strongylocentrotus purpuratus TaxID=7668 RepID=A0A7M7T4U7_STRPU|nr:deleted in malignant brain tumors 1 protein isoform X1 [Strongylocentrotus purpuratus]